MGVKPRGATPLYGVDGHRRVPGNQFASLVFEDADRAPFARHYQFGLPVPVQITEHRHAHHSQLLKPLTQHQQPSLVPHQQRIHLLRIPTSYQSPPHKQIQVPVPVHIPQRQRPHAEVLSQHALPTHLPFPVVDPHASSVGQSVFVICRAHQQPKLRSQHRRLVPRHHFLEGRFTPPLESSLAVVAIHPQPSPATAANHQILPAVSVHVIPAHPPPPLTHLLPQLRSPLHIIQGLLL